MKNTITYQSKDQTAVTIPLGQDYEVTREGNCLDLHLHRALAIDCPLTLTILIRTDGNITQWAARFDGVCGTNTYWHFASRPDHAVTDAQRKTLAGIHYRVIAPYGVRGCLGGPVCEAAFGGLTHDAIETLAGITPGSIAYNG